MSAPLTGSDGKFCTSKAMAVIISTLAVIYVFFVPDTITIGTFKYEFTQHSPASIAAFVSVFLAKYGHAAHLKKEKE